MPRRDRVALGRLPQRVEVGLAAERRAAGQKLIENDAQGVLVHLRAGVLGADGLLGGHVCRRAQAGAGARHPVRVGRDTGESEVRDLR